jgi:hypothetical protein
MTVPQAPHTADHRNYPTPDDGGRLCEKQNIPVHFAFGARCLHILGRQSASARSRTAARPISGQSRAIPNCDLALKSLLRRPNFPRMARCDARRLVARRRRQLLDSAAAVSCFDVHSVRCSNQCRSAKEVPLTASTGSFMFARSVSGFRHLTSEHLRKKPNRG